MQSPAEAQGVGMAALRPIERELARGGLRFRFLDRVLEERFQAELQDGARLLNRISVSLTIALFDAFIVSELKLMPEVIGFSAFLRFAIMTPAMLIFLLLDMRGVGRRWYGAMMSGVLIGPTLLAVIEATRVTNPLAVSNYQAMPLLLLVVLTCRVSLQQAIMINVSSCALFVWFALTAAFIPPAIRPSMILTDLALVISTLVFAWRIDTRDRQVFLFTRQAAIGGELLAAQNRALAKLSQMDALTGLSNRRCFDETLAAIWAESVGRPQAVTLIMFDIDCFKQFNDALGHQAGDSCLATLGRAAGRCLRGERDTLVRYGGEEFAVILPGTSLEEGSALAERIRLEVVARAVPHPASATGVALVTVSLGVASVVAPLEGVARLIEEADQCLYAAKRAGRNRVHDGREAPAAAWSRRVVAGGR